MTADIKDGVWCLFAAPGTNLSRVAHFTRKECDFYPLPRGITEYRLPLVHAGADGRLWLASYDGLVSLNRTSRSWVPETNFPAVSVTSFVNRGDETWCVSESLVGGLSGIGLWRNGKWRFYPAQVDGFTHLSEDGYLYFGGPGCLYAVDPGSLGPPVTIALPEGGAVANLLREQDGKLWFQLVDSNTNALFCRLPSRSAPRTLVEEANRRVRRDATIRPRIRGVDRYAIDQRPDAFRYSWRLDETAWTPFQPFPEVGLPVSDLGLGSHRLEIRAQNCDFAVESEPVQIPFKVLPVPLQERSWFGSTVGGVILIICLLAAMAMERAFKFKRTGTLLQQQIVVRQRAEAELQETHAALSKAHQELQFAHEELRKANAELEARVAERTNALTQANGQLQATNAELREEVEERQRAQAEVGRVTRQLLAASREAGMAEVATGVLHNVGNVLNSVNVSTQMMVDLIRKSRVANLRKAADLLQQHASDAGRFLAEDERGKQLPAYLANLGEHLAQEQATLLQEFKTLQRNVEHIKEIVAMQQSYARSSGSLEQVQLQDLVEDALRVDQDAFAQHRITLVREFSLVPMVNTDRHKVLQILVNLLSNAKRACEESSSLQSRVTIQLTQASPDTVRLRVTDTGVGIDPANLTRIFGFGFSTRKQGHGFGLHSSALAAKELGGSLSARSEGLGKGAEFILDLPLRSAP